MAKAPRDTPGILGELPSLGREALALEWASIFHCPAPTRVHAPFLRAAIAWQLQRDASEYRGSAGAGKLRRALHTKGTPALAAGTRLVREWRGQVHQVEVTGDGFRYRDQHYRSLSAIARAITGTAWSGPAFFGLR